MTDHGMSPSIVELPERAVAVVRHHGPPEAVDETRRPLYRHMIIHELVGGPSILRWLDEADGDRVVDALVQTHMGFPGDDVCHVEHLPAGRHAAMHFHGRPQDAASARQWLLSWCAAHGWRPVGPVLQVHLMDPVEGELEAEFQVPVEPSGANGA